MAVVEAIKKAGVAGSGFNLSASRDFSRWLAGRCCSLALTSHQSGKLFLLGTNASAELSIFERSFERPMGLYADDKQIWLSTLYSLHRFTNSLPDGGTEAGFDRKYIPQASYITGGIDIHDLNVRGDGRPIFVSSLFGCLATTDNEYSFRPLWQPAHQSELVPENRSHLSGLAMRDGQAAYVTAASESDVANGWRSHRRDGGVVIDVESKEVVARGLSMPQSPRWYRGELWVANAGAGQLGTVDLASGKFEPKVLLPGFVRGLSFIDNYAVVGLSKPRYNAMFSGLSLAEKLAKKGLQARCGVCVINLDTGRMEHQLSITGKVSELYDVAVMPEVRRASFIGFRNDQIRHTLHIGPEM